MRSGKTPLQYSQDFGPSPLANIPVQTGHSTQQASSDPTHQDANGDASTPAGPSKSFTSPSKPLQLTDVLDAQPALAQVGTLEAALEAIMAGLEDACAAAQPQLDAAAASRQAVIDLVAAEAL